MGHACNLVRLGGGARAESRANVGAVRVAAFASTVLLLASSAPGVARAGEARCWHEGGTLVVPAEVAGIAGDFILDTGTPHSLLHDTAARTHGYAEDRVEGDVRLAGMKIASASLGVADLDLRTWNLPTPVAGVIGADLLKDFVLDVRYAPCRVRLWAPGRAPRPRGRVLPLGWDAGRPTATVRVGDGARDVQGPFVIATGANAPVRLADDLAQADADKPAELYPDGVWLARLPVVSFAGAMGRDVPAGLMKPDGDVAGVLGADALAHFHLRFDFPAERLTVRLAR